MLMQFNSAHPMLGGSYLSVFASDFREIPEWIRQPYSLRAVGVSKLTNIAQIEADLKDRGFTYGIKVPVSPNEERLAFTYLRHMESHG